MSTTDQTPSVPETPKVDPNFVTPEIHKTTETTYVIFENDKVIGVIRGQNGADIVIDSLAHAKMTELKATKKYSQVYSSVETKKVVIYTQEAGLIYNGAILPTITYSYVVTQSLSVIRRRM